jgi:AcrR family transcriptional regulator
MAATRRLRADARRNRARIVAAATELFAEQGIDVPLDAIARRAEVGIGTLYRRFADRDEVAQAVALDAFATVTQLARDAVASEPDSALRTFLHAVSERRIGVLMASLLPVLPELPTSAELAETFGAMLAAVEALVDHAHGTGELRPDVTAEDVMLLLALLTRPLQRLPIPYSAAVTPRLLHLVLEGIMPSDRTSTPPAAPAPLDVDLDLRRT